MAPIRKVCTKWEGNIQKIYNPGECNTTDEAFGDISRTLLIQSAKLGCKPEKVQGHHVVLDL